LVPLGLQNSPLAGCVAFMLEKQLMSSPKNVFLNQNHEMTEIVTCFIGEIFLEGSVENHAFLILSKKSTFAFFA
jgi:hypothetical protein